MRYVAIAEMYGKPGELIDMRRFPETNWNRALSLNMVRQATEADLKRRRRRKAKELPNEPD